jgi:hypothetical protein
MYSSSILKETSITSTLPKQLADLLCTFFAEFIIAFCSVFYKAANSIKKSLLKWQYII